MAINPIARAILEGIQYNFLVDSLGLQYFFIIINGANSVVIPLSLINTINDTGLGESREVTLDANPIQEENKEGERKAAGILQNTKKLDPVAPDAVRRYNFEGTILFTGGLISLGAGISVDISQIIGSVTDFFSFKQFLRALIDSIQINKQRSQTKEESFNRFLLYSATDGLFGLELDLVCDGITITSSLSRDGIENGLTVSITASKLLSSSFSLSELIKNLGSGFLSGQLAEDIEDIFNAGGNNTKASDLNLTQLSARNSARIPEDLNIFIQEFIIENYDIYNLIGYNTTEDFKENISTFLEPVVIGNVSIAPKFEAELTLFQGTIQGETVMGAGVSQITINNVTTVYPMRTAANLNEVFFANFESFFGLLEEVIVFLSRSATDPLKCLKSYVFIKKGL